MKLAFYAPLKPPDHPVPSGDRAMARGLMAALELAGAEVSVASTLRSRDGTGDTAVQARLIEEAEAICPQIIAAGRTAGWKAWITYHSYYKAPDLIGGAVAQALAIPYVLIEATRARKRLYGPWARFAHLAEAACDAAQVIFHVTERDAQALARDAPQGQHLIHLRPFLARRDLPQPSTLDGPMLSVGMMRASDKMASYRIIADTLATLPADGWHLTIAGDGAAREAVEGLMAPFGPRVTLMGALEAADLSAAYGQASLMLWPGVNEAFGLVYLEAQAAGVPIVAQDRPGVRDVLTPGLHPTPEDGPQALAARVKVLLADPDMRRREGRTARAHVAAHHLLPAAAATLRAGLARVGVHP